MSVRVRFAPSPTGYLHVGGARTALFNWLFARKMKGQFVLRIEDTDDARNTEIATQAIFEGMRWLGLDWDEGPEAGGDCGPYFQSQRREIYDRYLDLLDQAGRVYTEENGAVRFKFSRQPIIVPDLICGDVEFAATEEPDMTIRRPDGSYIFHFVNVVDDIEMGITHVFRGEDHLSNTWKHIDLFNAFGKTSPTYAHIPLLLNPSGTKMSKRDEGAAVASYQEDGYLPAAVFNYLCLLGWTPRAESEKLDRASLIEIFETSEIHSSNARFDIAKLNWLNGLYLRELDAAALFDAAKPFLDRAGIDLSQLADPAAAIYSVREKITTLAELGPWVHYFFREDFPFDPDMLAKLQSKPENANLLAAAAASIGALTEWTEETLQQAIQDAAASQSVKPGALMPLLRAALSGQHRGPGVTTIAHLLGQPRTLSRLAAAQAKV